MTLKKENIVSFLLAFFVSMVLNLPSLKILYSSNLLNLIALAGLLIVGIYRSFILRKDKINLNTFELNYIMQFLLIWITLFWITTLIKPVNFTFSSLLQFISVIIFALGVIIFIKKSELKYIFVIQLFWGITLAIFEMTKGIPKDRSLGQHYLTTGVPIALTIVMLFGFIYSSHFKKHQKILFIPVILILYLGLFSLSGRAPILFSVIVPLIIVFIGLFYEKVRIKKYFKLIIYPILVSIIFYVLFMNLPERIINRMLRLFQSITDEPRFLVYLESINAILNNPQGLGLLGFMDLKLGYPHNIILEIIMSGGLVMIIPLTIFIASIFRSILYNIKYRGNTVIWLAMMIYMFLTWNVSFQLSSSYMLFTIISLYIVSSGDLSIAKDKIKKPVFSAEEYISNISYLTKEESVE